MIVGTTSFPLSRLQILNNFNRGTRDHPTTPDTYTRLKLAFHAYFLNVQAATCMKDKSSFDMTVRNANKIR